MKSIRAALEKGLRAAVDPVINWMVRGRVHPNTLSTLGFLITCSTQSPKGEHVIYGTYLISASPYEPGDEDAVMTMQQRKLTTRATLLTPPH